MYGSGPIESGKLEIGLHFGKDQIGNTSVKGEKAARLAAREDLGAELKNTVSGLLLQSQLALAENGVPNHVAQKLCIVEDLAGKLRLQLTAAPPAVQENKRSA